MWPFKKVRGSYTPEKNKVPPPPPKKRKPDVDFCRKCGASFCAAMETIVLVESGVHIREIHHDPFPRRPAPTYREGQVGGECEHLERTCPKCGYRWHEPCHDDRKEERCAPPLPENGLEPTFGAVIKEGRIKKGGVNSNPTTPPPPPPSGQGAKKEREGERCRDTCWNKNKTGRDIPCVSCFTAEGFYLNWQPRTGIGEEI